MMVVRATKPRGRVHQTSYLFLSRRYEDYQRSAYEFKPAYCNHDFVRTYMGHGDLQYISYVEIPFGKFHMQSYLKLGKEFTIMEDVFWQLTVRDDDYRFRGHLFFLVWNHIFVRRLFGSSIIPESCILRPLSRPISWDLRVDDWLRSDLLSGILIFSDRTSRKVCSVACKQVTFF